MAEYHYRVTGWKASALLYGVGVLPWVVGWIWLIHWLAS